MNLQFENNLYTDMQEKFNTLDQQTALFLSHYQLAEELTDYTADQWKQFLNDPKVAQWFATEMEMYKDFQLRQMIKKAADNDRSVGAASMINSLNKSIQEGRTKEGPVIIYTHVPLTEEQQATPVETRELDVNIFAGQRAQQLEEAEEWED